MVVGKEREDLINSIVMYMSTLGVTDLSSAKNRLYILCNHYEIQERTTEVAILKEDRNEDVKKRFLTAKILKGCTKRTIEFYAKTIDMMFEMIPKTVDDITTEDIRYMLAVKEMRDKNSKVTINNIVRNLKSFFGWLHSEGYIQNNPAFRVEKAKEPKVRKKAFSEMDIERLRAATRDERERVIVELLLSTGCRLSELVNIRLDEIETERILVHGKGTKDRYVYLNAKSQFALANYLNQRTDENPYLFAGCLQITEEPEIRKYKHSFWKHPECLLPDVPITKDSIGQGIRNLGKRAGVEDTHPHRFRRTCATLAYRKGMPLEMVALMLGHADVKTTQIYLERSEDDLKQAHIKYVG